MKYFFALVNALTARESELPDLISSAPKPQLHLAQVEVCAASGMLPTRYCPEKKVTWFIPGRSPIKRDDVYREVALERKSGLRACHFDGEVEFAVYEFWSSDLLNLWQRAGIKRRVPPPFAAGCDPAKISRASVGMAPQITAPQVGIEYVMQRDRALQIPLVATVDGEVKMVYWFVDRAYVGASAPGKILWWQGRAGKFTVRVIDDHGRTAAAELSIVNG